MHLNQNHFLSPHLVSIQDLRLNLITQYQFFDLFERHAALIVEAALYLQKELTDNNLSDGIKRLEHQADKVTQECMAALHRTFITPIDRDQIHRLITELDNIIDDIDKTADCLTIYKVHKPNPSIKIITERIINEICFFIKKFKRFFLFHQSIHPFQYERLSSVTLFLNLHLLSLALSAHDL